MAEPPPPLILCMENINGEEVSLKIEEHDTFEMFLEKYKLLVGYDIDLNSITGNQQVSLNENAYTFLLNTEQNLINSSLNPPNYDLANGQSGADDLVYILDDGTQIRASQIQFDNEDPLTDLTLEKIPFIKYADVIDETDEVDYGDRTLKDINITSPVSHRSSPKCNFANTLPFKLVCSNASAFELQFTKYLEERSYTTLQTANKNKSPRTLINDNFKNLDNINRDSYTREDILNMFKNSPVTPLPCDSQNCEKRRHVRKTDPSRIVYKTLNAKPITDIDINGKHDCFICGKIISNNEKLYIFDREDQMLHRCEQKKYTQLKVICEMCLTENFVASPLKSPNQSLNNDEYLVIKNNQQYIFQKITSISFKKTYKSKVINENVVEEPSEFVKVEIGPDGEIITKPVDNDEKSDDVILIKDDKKESYSDVEIIEPEPEIDLDNIEEDENVKEFLGKYQSIDVAVEQLKCRFCDTTFQDYIAVMDHGEEHQHNLEDGVVFPCPLCDYGYANIKWLKGHIKVAHNNNKTEEVTPKEENDKPSHESSPVAKRTRSSIKKTEGTQESQEIEECQANIPTGLTFTTEIKQECLDSDDSIWIVQTGDDEQLKNLLVVHITFVTIFILYSKTSLMIT